MFKMFFFLMNYLFGVKREFEAHAGGKEPSLDSPVMAKDNKQGVILSEQEQPTVTTRVENRAVISTTRAQRYNDDDDWSLMKMLSRNNLFATLDWDGTALAGVPIVTYDVLKDLLVNEISVTPFLRFERFRCGKINVRAEIIGNRFCQGRIWLVWFPSCLPKSNLAVNYIPALTSLSTLTHISLDPNQGTVATLSIPFVFNKQFVDLVNGDCLGQIYVVPASQFIPGATGAPSAKIKLYVSIEDAQFKQPRPGVVSFSELVADRHVRSNTERVMVSRTFHAHGLLDGVIDSGADELKEVINNIVPDELVGDLFGVLDKPSIPVNPDVIVFKEQQYLSNCSNISYDEYLSGYPKSQQLCDADVFGTSVDEMMIDELIKKKASFVANVPWTTANNVGDVLFSTDIGPMAGFPISRDPNVGSPITMLDNVSSRFSFWAGGIRYIIEVVGTAFHEGKLDFNYHPTLNKTSGAALTPQNSVTQYSYSHFVRNANNIISLSFPYLGDTPYKKVWRGQNLTDVFVSEAPALRFTDYFSGSFILRVAAKLNAPETVSSGVNLLIYQLADSDYTLAMNTLTGGSLQHVAELPTISRTFVADSKEKVATKVDDVPDRNKPMYTYKAQELCAGKGKWSDVSNSQFGETYKSLRDLSKKFQRAYRFSSDINPAILTAEQGMGSSPNIFHFPIMHWRSLGGTPRVSNHNSWLATMFRLYRGANNFKCRTRAYLVPKTAAGSYRQVEVRAYWTPLDSNPDNEFDANSWDLFPTQSTNLTQGLPLSMGYSSSTQTAEIKVPFLTNRTSVLNRHAYDEDFTGFLAEDFLNQELLCALYFEGLPPAAALTDYAIRLVIEIDESFSDEAMFGLYIGMPKFYIQNSSVSPVKAMGPDQWVLPAPIPEGSKRNISARR